MAAWAVVLAELAVALFSARRELSTTWEVQVGLLGLAPTALVASAAVALVGALLAWLLEQSELGAVRGLLAALGAGAGARVGVGVGGGRHLSTPVQRGSFALLVAALAFALIWTL